MNKIESEHQLTVTRRKIAELKERLGNINLEKASLEGLIADLESQVLRYLDRYFYNNE